MLNLVNLVILVARAIARWVADDEHKAWQWWCHSVLGQYVLFGELL